MAIRTLNLVVLVFTVCGGMLLAGIYAWTAADRDRAILELNALRLGEERLESLTKRLDVVLTAADLAVGSGETYSANWARDQSYLLGSDVQVLERDGDVLARHIDAESLVAALNELGQSIGRDQTLSSGALARFDAASIAVIELLLQAKASLNASIAQQGISINRVTTRAWWAQVISAGCFILLSITLSSFGVRTIVRPLENIQRASESEDPNVLADEAFYRAPTEIRNLASALRRYLGHLNATVAERTRELEKQTDELREEVKRRSNAEAAMAVALEQAEEASAAKSDFLSVTSHELRTPLNTMTAALALLRQGELALEQQRYCDLATEAGENLGVLLRDILDFSAVDAGTINLVTAPVSLMEFAERVVEHSTVVAQAKGVTLASYIAPGMTGTALIDQHRVRQVIDNLITNALKFSRGKLVHLSFTQRLGSAGLTELVIKISDDGPGISEEQQDAIFKPFTQLDPSLGRNSGGVGLGLSLCKNLARAMDGDCTVISRLGDGSTFEFWLPIPQARRPIVDESDAATDVTESGQNPSRRLLLVEDSEVNQMLTQKLLENHGHTVALASDGYEACEVCLQEPFDAILMDLQMPGIDGLEATRRIKATEGVNQNTPVIALTANVGSAFHAAAEEAGMVGFVEKPIDTDKMGLEIDRVLGKTAD